MRPWEMEPDEFTGEHEGYKTLILRVEHTGHLCGYVGVPKSHPLFGKDYMDCITVDPSRLEERIDMEKVNPLSILSAAMADGKETQRDNFRLDLAFDVHGGITYSGNKLRNHASDDTWYFGFDCAHCDDYMPRMPDFSTGTYRDIEYVKAECESLAKQIKKYEIIPQEAIQ